MDEHGKVMRGRTPDNRQKIGRINNRTQSSKIRNNQPDNKLKVKLRDKQMN